MNDFIRYNIDEYLEQHIQSDFDLSCNVNGDLNKSIIYVIYYCSDNGGEILYVGQTNVNPMNRLKLHINNLLFNMVAIKQLQTNDRDIVNLEEQKYIKKLSPVLQHKFTSFEKQNFDGQKTYKEVLKWIQEQDTPRRPGRPKTKEPSKNINIAIPIRLLDTLQEMRGEYGLNMTQYIINLIKKDLELS